MPEAENKQSIALLNLKISIAYVLAFIASALIYKLVAVSVLYIKYGVLYFEFRSFSEISIPAICCSIYSIKLRKRPELPAGNLLSLISGSIAVLCSSYFMIHVFDIGVGAESFLGGTQITASAISAAVFVTMSLVFWIVPAERQQ
ncbi:hypothetical protein [Neoaquamicrobium sediminum]|uniref:Uncharacterized protein n=1 Tax=Neoaquamicrobium sediminum TaxID=1849104 RepID=A0ABV3WUN8_9HYPH